MAVFCGRALRVWCLLAVCTLWLHAVCECGAARVVLASRAKQPRSTRQFKNTESLATGRTFGKRAQLTKADFLGYENAENFLDLLENSQERNIMDQSNDKIVESLPLDWFVNEMMENPELARTIVRKFIDANQDGFLSTDELLRNNY